MLNLGQPTANFGSKVVFGKQLPIPKWYKNKFIAPVHLWWQEQCGSSNRLIFVLQNLEDLGANGGSGSKFLVENVTFGIDNHDLPIHYATFMGLWLWLRVVYSWAPRLLSIIGRKKLPFWDKIWPFWGINREFNIKFKFYNHRKAHPCMISCLLSYRA